MPEVRQRLTLLTTRKALLTEQMPRLRRQLLDWLNPLIQRLK
ncbi:hypothetical protein COO91_03395 [Nostoc flagelliforme CCNUN1]|uniref:Uncharacterized protein n=1 Tax=Nostoc flagelliforme CCNUN1 TaxID=2038116 RepID=A0A2K8SQ30_9NOSO|nr:hypothetical protein COO91_03395 [Nostoc flagelliforme CCNUN1]